MSLAFVWTTLSLHDPHRIGCPRNRGNSSLEGEALGAFCRHHGLFTDQLQQWRQAFEQGLTPAPAAREELRELKHSNSKLERELRRKEKALAEAAALLVLQTNVHQLWENKGE